MLYTDFKATAQEGENPDFKLAVCNQKFSNAYEQTPAALFGKTASELFTEERMSEIRNVYELKKPFYQEYFHEEQQKWTGISLSRHDHGIALTEMDISLLKTAQVQQDEMIGQLSNSYEMIESLSVMKEYVQHRGSFLRTTFHDLRGSFGIVVGAAAMLDMMQTDEDRNKILDMIQRNLSQVSRMMNQLLDYSRLESGEETLQTESFDAASVLKELCEGATRIAKEKAIHFSFEGTYTIPVEGDHVKTRRIAQNLILNAIKYTSQGSVTVNWKVLDQDKDESLLWEFSVADTGPGIPAHILSKLSGTEQNQVEQNSDDIFQLQPSNFDGHGEGIGLFIVKRLCELLNATMYVSSSVDSGTQFRIVFPMLPGQNIAISKDEAIKA